MENKHSFYMCLAEKIAEASYCERSKVGALLERDGNIIAFGYNGTPKGFDNCCEVDNVTKPEVLHAESNAIAKCAQSTVSSFGCNLYVTTAPCFECAKLIIQSGIRRVFYLKEYRKDDGLKLLIAAGVSCTQLHAKHSEDTRLYLFNPYTD